RLSRWIGTRSTSGKRQARRKMPLRNGAISSVVLLDNLQRILPKGSMMIVPITCTARFGKPLRVEPGEEKAEFLARARAAVIELA
ncbi:1-acyl-sn-glycerol-3-phosphate acyltransferase, partial [Rhizobium ruizarguesonis]